MTDKKINVIGESDEQLKRAHEQVTVTAPRWAFDILAGATEAVGDSEAASNNLRADCQSAVKILRARLDDVEGDE